MPVNKELVQIRKIFIANRGEIARRIAMTAQKLGIQTVAITSKSPPPAYLVDVVTDFALIEEESTQTYLNIELMIETAKSHGADAIHPGFGFLSENDLFAEAVINAGLTWIGPSPSAIHSMASKASARAHAGKAQVPCLPGLSGIDINKADDTISRDLHRFAEASGFPLLIKAAYGGGGKGMRIVNSKTDLEEQARRASTEALSSFGNGSLIIEKYLPATRHVEVQVMADKHHQVVIFGDRDCSLQRRHQKIIEECPAPHIPPDIRAAMHAAAKALALAVNYDNAGTVEFLLDETNPTKPEFYFLEMNTRLQVEHTVTEEVFGVDLVEWQIKVASGEMLPHEFSSLKPRGHSVEARIYAEDPGLNFFPAPGPVRAFAPLYGRGIRWEIGMETIDEITPKFDPMVSKLICTAGDRSQAFHLLQQTLERTIFAGPRNNIPFLIWLARHPKILEKPVDTHFIANNTEDALNWEAEQRKSLESLATTLLNSLEHHRSPSHQPPAPGSHIPSVQTITNLAFSGSFAPSAMTKISTQVISQFYAWSNHDAKVSSRYGNGLFGHENGSSNSKFQYVIHAQPNRVEFWIGLNGHNWVRVDQRSARLDTSDDNSQSNDGMTAPVPGKVIQVNITVGKPVREGDVLFVLESMKMQFEVKASHEGIPQIIHVSPGDQVNAGQRLGDWR